jgi:hypothetical protein
MNMVVFSNGHLLFVIHEKSKKNDSAYSTQLLVVFDVVPALRLKYCDSTLEIFLSDQCKYTTNLITMNISGPCLFYSPHP